MMETTLTNWQASTYRLGQRMLSAGEGASGRCQKEPGSNPSGLVSQDRLFLAA